MYYMITIAFLHYSINAPLGSNWTNLMQSDLYCKWAVSNILSPCTVYVYIPIIIQCTSVAFNLLINVLTTIVYALKHVI